MAVPFWFIMHESNRRLWFLLLTGVSQLTVVVVVVVVVCGAALVLTLVLIDKSRSGLSVWVYDQQVLCMRLAKWPGKSKSFFFFCAEKLSIKQREGF